MSIESGLTYTYLKSSNKYDNAHIKLHYLGIPLKGILTAYNNDKISLYGSVGGMVELNIAGRYEDHIGTKNMRTNHLQWSVGASAGLEVKLVKPISLFAEPGVVYYFDDGTNIPTIRKAKPLNFNLQIGLRFNIK